MKLTRGFALFVLLAAAARPRDGRPVISPTRSKAVTSACGTPLRAGRLLARGTDYIKNTAAMHGRPDASTDNNGANISKGLSAAGPPISGSTCISAAGSSPRWRTRASGWSGTCSGSTARPAAGPTSHMHALRQGGVNSILLRHAPSWGGSGFDGAVENRWYCIEVKAPGFTAAATVDWWVDGVKQVQMGPYDWTGASSWTGLERVDALQLPTWKQAMYIDDLVVSDAYNGQLSGSAGSVQLSNTAYSVSEGGTSASITSRGWAGARARRAYCAPRQTGRPWPARTTPLSARPFHGATGRWGQDRHRAHNQRRQPREQRDGEHNAEQRVRRVARSPSSAVLTILDNDTVAPPSGDAHVWLHVEASTYAPRPTPIRRTSPGWARAAAGASAAGAAASWACQVRPRVDGSRLAEANARTGRAQTTS